MVVRAVRGGGFEKRKGRRGGEEAWLSAMKKECDEGVLSGVLKKKGRGGGGWFLRGLDRWILSC